MEIFEYVFKVDFTYFFSKNKDRVIGVSYSHGGKYVLNFGLLCVWASMCCIRPLYIYLVCLCHLGHL